MGTHAEWSEYCFEHSLTQHFPCLRFPSGLSSGLHFMRGEPENIEYKEVLDVAWNKFKIHFNFNLFEKTSDGVEAFGFGTDCRDHHTEELLLKELPLLRYFTQDFRKKHKKLFGLLDDNQIDLSQDVGSSPYYQLPKQKVSFERERFLSELGCQSMLQLTAREKDVLKLLVCGFPASYMKDQLSLSIRTVENYITNIKEKLNCSSKVALIQKAQEIASTGWLDE